MAKHTLYSVSNRLKKAILKFRRVLFSFRLRRLCCLARAKSINAGGSSRPRLRNLSFNGAAAELGFWSFLDVKNNDEEEEEEECFSATSASLCLSRSSSFSYECGDDDDEYDVDERAEEFIKAFYSRLREERLVFGDGMFGVL